MCRISGRIGRFWGLVACFAWASPGFTDDRFDFWINLINEIASYQDERERAEEVKIICELCSSAGVPMARLLKEYAVCAETREDSARLFAANALWVDLQKRSLCYFAGQSARLSQLIEIEERQRTLKRYEMIRQAAKASKEESQLIARTRARENVPVSLEKIIEENPCVGTVSSSTTLGSNSSGEWIAVPVFNPSSENQGPPAFVFTVFNLLR